MNRIDLVVEDGLGAAAVLALEALGRALERRDFGVGSDELFHDGGMCANREAVHLLAEYGHRTSYRQRGVRDAVRRCVRAMVDRLAATGGGYHFELSDVAESESSSSRTTNGLAFVLFTLRYLQAMDPEARDELGHVLNGRV